MEKASDLAVFAVTAGISVSYASQILSGARKPSLPLSISIYRKTGHKFGPIEHASDHYIDEAERLHGLAAA